MLHGVENKTGQNHAKTSDKERKQNLKEHTFKKVHTNSLNRQTTSERNTVENAISESAQEVCAHLPLSITPYSIPMHDHIVVYNAGIQYPAQTPQQRFSESGTSAALRHSNKSVQPSY